VYNPLSLLDLLIPLALGILCGYLLRNRKMPKLDRLSLGIIVVLIFALGFGIGSDNTLLSALPQVGLQAIVIAVLSIAFSIVFVKVGKRLVKTE
jgi:hypothetical protein